MVRINDKPRIGRSDTARLNSPVELGSSAANRGMPALRRIVVPIDFSEPSLHALQFAALLAAQSGAALLPVYVAEHVVYFDETLAFPEHHVLEQMKEKLAQLAREQVSEEVPVFPHVEKGKPWAEIIRLAEQHEADLIVLGTHGRTGLQHWLLGSTAERVVQHSSCPVLVVPSSSKSGSPFQRTML